MVIKVLGSSSKGNCYLIDKLLILEAGISLKEVKKELDFDLSSVKGCLITHSHGDHSKYVKDYVASGVDCYMTKETKEKLGIEHHRIKEIESEHLFEIDGFKILPFKTQHDCDGSVGFYINSEYGNILFATDTYYLQYKFENLNHILIEANYSEDILQNNVESGNVSEFVANRIRKSHFELENVKEWLLANDLSRVKSITLIHLSDQNSDSKMFKEEIENLTFIKTEIADTGKLLPLT
ncbi:MBL fold metallo-hydrolase [Geotoga petraea]|uniref:Phosphoribosyl 1,2-cyclic phosphodiesterase n=1 Tax=Geotoga petraea TaxID=28234 RepID=A0A1G6LQQ3_9BACT|nr:MBL fold metallo-hydrolase [Geotoga petraea]SDC45434.1 Phosphoribosyl 1,2-cyclic phosphodiesterase [Geotoga petraea]